MATPMVEQEPSSWQEAEDRGSVSFVQEILDDLSWPYLETRLF